MVKIAIFGRNNVGGIDVTTRIWIAGAPGVDVAKWTPISSESRSIRREQQMEGGAGYDFKRPIDRGNETFTESFTTVRTFEESSFGAGDAELVAWQFCNSFSHGDSSQWPHPLEGDFVLRYELPNFRFVESRIFNGLISKPNVNRNGATVELTYQLTGGRIEPFTRGVDLGDSGDDDDGTVLPADLFDIPLAGAAIRLPPTFTFFGTNTGGVPLLGNATTWPAGWDNGTDAGFVGSYLEFRVSLTLPGSAAIGCYMTFSGITATSGFTTGFAPRLANQLAAVAAHLNAWPAFAGRVQASVQTVSGRSALVVSVASNVTNSTLSLSVLAFNAGSYSGSLLSASYNGAVTETDVLPLDSSDIIPSALNPEALI